MAPNSHRDDRLFIQALEACAREPIHIPGQVQSFGVILVIDENDLIVQCGGGTEELFGRSASTFLGQHLSSIFNSQDVERIRKAFAVLSPDINQRLGGISLSPFGLNLEISVHLRDGLRLIEVYQVGNEISESKGLSHAIADVINEVTQSLTSEEPFECFVQTVTEKLFYLTGYDRVMVYRFDANWNGEVIAECHKDGMSSFLGLWYPASDIPPQARALYLLNKLRVFADVDAEPRPLIPRINPLTNRELDLSLAIVRAMSPVHQEYLRNMKVKATLVASVVVKGRLWGLIACHHNQSRVPSSLTLRLTESIAHLLSCRIQLDENQDRMSGLKIAHELLSKLKAISSGQIEFEAAIIAPEIRLMEILRADGIAVVNRGKYWTRGSTPLPEQIGKLINWLEQSQESRFITNSLTSIRPEFKDFTASAAGVIAIRFPYVSSTWLIWFRGEISSQVKWAGDPRQGLIEGKTPRLSPRNSFETWIELVQGCSRPWSTEEMAIVDEVIRPNLTEILLQVSNINLQNAEKNLWLMKEIIENVRDVIVVTDPILELPGPRIVFANSALENMTGYTPDEVIGQNPRIFQGPKTDRASLKLIREHLLQKKSLTIELLNYSKNGQEYWIEASISPIRDKSGEITHFISVQRDITDRKLTELALANREALYRLLTDQMRDVIVLAHINGGIEYVSPSCQFVYGYTSEEMKAFGLWHLVYSEDLSIIQRAWAECQSGIITTVEWRAIHKLGHSIWVETLLTPLTNDEKRVDQVILTSRDITKRRLLEDQLRQTQKMDAIGKLAGGIAHDFNNLLTVINGSVELFLSTFPQDYPDRELLESIKEAGIRGAKLTRQLLAFSRQQIVKPELFDLNQVVQESCRMLSRLIGEDIQLVIELPEESLIIEADKGQIDQLLLNLVLNSRDAMPTGGRIIIQTKAVELLAGQLIYPLSCPPGRYASLSVTDSGQGIPPELINRVFEPFFTTKPIGKGTGLGLATVHGIVAQRGGGINVKSQLGSGTTIDVYFPLASHNPNLMNKTIRPNKSVQGNETVLVVEDEPTVRKLIIKALQSNGYQVLEAQSAADAIAICENCSVLPDLLITDVVMPDMNGRELAECLLSRHSQLKVLYVSGYSSDAILRHGVEHLELAFLQKPFKIDNLVLMVRNLLNKT